jgi:thiamine-phosphate pyrophosphorylase
VTSPARNEPRAAVAERLRAARLYLAIEAGRADVVEVALGAGVDMVQLRDKDADDASLRRAARELRDACRAHGALFVVNDRPDVALECGADAVHLGQDDAPVEAVRGEVRERLAIGLSTHSAEQIAAAEASSADYYAVGPVRETPTKPGRPAVGLELIRHAARVAAKPWFAIGGIDAANAHEVAAAGARRVVVVRAIRDAEDPEAAARALSAAIGTEAPVGH